MKINHKLNTVIFFLPSIVVAICSIVSLPFLTNELEISDFGYFYLCSIIVNFLGSFSLLGGTVSMAKNFHGQSLDKQKKFASNIFFLSLLVGCFFSIITLISWKLFLINFLQNKNHLYIMVFILFIYGFQTHISEILTIKNRPFSYGLFIGSQSIFGAIINIYLIINYDFGVDTLFYSMFGSGFLSLLLILFFSYEYIKNIPDVSTIKSILREYKIAISNFFENLFIFLERNLVYKLFGLDIFALFNYGKSYETHMLAINKAIVRGVYSTSLTEFKERQEFSYCKKSIDYILLVIYFFGIFFATIGYDFISIISNDKFSKASYFVCLFCILRIFNNTNVAYNIAIIVKGKIKSFANIVYFDKLSLLILILLFVPFFKLKGLIFAYLCSAIILKLYFIKTAKKYHDVPFLEKNIFFIFLLLISILLLSINFAENFYTRLILFILSLLSGIFYFRFEIYSFFSYSISQFYRK